MVTIRWFAGAAEAAGHDEEQVAPGGTTLAELVAQLAERDEGLARVLGACTFLVDGRPATPTTLLPTGARVDVLPPFAGG